MSFKHESSVTEIAVVVAVGVRLTTYLTRLRSLFTSHPQIRWMTAAAVLIAAVLLSPLQAQTVTIGEDGVRSDGTSIRLATLAGDGKAGHTHLTVVNRSHGDVRYKVHLHDGSNLINFHGDNGGGDIALPFTDGLDANTDRRDVFPVYLKREPGDGAGVYHDEIVIEVWDRQTNRRLGYAEVPVVVWLRTTGFPRRRPEGYQMWTNDSGLLQRLRLADLPLSVTSNDPQQARVVRRAISLWNEAGRKVGVTEDYFRYASNHSADITIDWSGRNLPRGAAGAALLRTSGSQSVIGGIVMRRTADEAKLGETLVQELGHILGLGHSSEPNDIMAPTVHQHWHASLEYVEVTQRDLSALWWLYDQRRFVPIIAARN